MIDFGQVFIGADSTFQFYIENVGGGTLSGAITTPDGFTVMETGGTTPASSLIYSLAGGESKYFDLTFSPLVAQMYDDHVSVSVFPLQEEFIHVLGQGVPQTGLIEPEIYNETKLIGNFPNPVGNSTLISYQLKGSSQAQDVLIDIYNIHGDYVTTVKGEQGQAYVDCSHMGNGIYLYKIQQNDKVHVQKMVILK